MTHSSPRLLIALEFFSSTNRTGSSTAAFGATLSASPSKFGWKNSLRVGAAIWALALFMASPPFSSWNWSNLASTRAGDFIRLSQHPLSRDLVEGILAYRIATPFVAWLLHLPPAGALALPFLFSLGAIVVLHQAVARRSDNALANTLTIAVACSSTFRYTQGWLGMADGLTHLCTAVALISSPPVAAFSIAIGCLNDERALLTLPFIALWRYPALEPARQRGLNAVRTLLVTAAPLVTGLAVALVIRHALSAGWIGPGVSPPLLYRAMGASVHSLVPWIQSWGVWLANGWNGPGWLWLLLVPPCVSARFRPGPIPAAILTFAFLLVCLSTFVVADVARSIGFAFPAALLGGVWMYEREPKVAGKVALLAAALQVATPAIWLYEQWQWFQFRPFPWEFWLFLHSR